MSGIFGLVLATESSTLQPVLDRMKRSMQVSHTCTASCESSLCAGLGSLQSATDTCLATAGSTWLAFSGQIVRDEVFQTRLSRVPDPPAALAEQLLALFTAGGEAMLGGLNGRYVIAAYDCSRRRLVLINDRYGLEPLYYWQAPEGLVFASQMKAIAAHPAFKRHVDPVALADLLATGQMLAERALYAGVAALPPGSRLAWQDGAYQIETYVHLKLYQNGSYAPDLPEAVETLHGHLNRAIKRRLIDGSSLLVTGGLDSRLLAGGLMETGNGHSLEAFTLGHERSREVLIGREIAGLAGLPHSMIPANPGYISDYAARCVALTEGNMNIHAAWILGVEEHIQTHPTRAVITGVGGEGISGRHLLAELANPNLDQALNWLSTQHFQYPQAERLLRPELTPALVESRAWLTEIMEQAPGNHPLSRYDFYHYRQMRRHPTGSVLSNATLVIEPYFDNDLVDFALSLPPEMRAMGRMFKGLLNERFPLLAAVGGTGSLADGGREVPLALRRLDSLARQVRRRMNRYLLFLNPTLTGDRPDSAIYYNHWLRNAARPFVTRLLQRDDLLGDYLDMQAVQSLLESHMSGRRNAFRTLGALVTFALWRQQFT